MSSTVYENRFQADINERSVTLTYVVMCCTFPDGQRSVIELMLLDIGEGFLQTIITCG